MSFRKLLRATAFILLVAVQGVYAASSWNGSSFMDSAAATGATKLHAVGITGRGVSVAVIDSPYAVYNSYIADNIIDEASYGIRTVDGFTTAETGRNAVALPNLDFGNNDSLSHGTHVAGTVVGMAPDSGLVLLAGFSYDTSGGDLSMLENSAALMHYAAGIADEYNIVSLNGSFGSPFWYYYGASEADRADLENPSTAAALAALRAQGILPVFSAGNEAANNVLPIPAAMGDAIAVGAYGPSGAISSFSNLNSKVVLLAPGESISSAVPEWLNGGDELGLMQGTSMAAPHVSGAIALLASGVRSASIDEIYQALIDGADVISSDTINFLDRLEEQLENRTENPAYPLEALDPLLENEYRVLRVDKAYSILSSTRTRGIYEEVRQTKSPYADMYRALANELGADVGDAAVVFQLLEALSLSEKVRVAREMSPVVLAAGSETIHVATGDMHTALGRRLSGNRLNYEMQGNACEVEGYPKPMPNTRQWMEEIPGDNFTVWAEGSGGWLNRDATRWDRDYNSHHGGVTVGGEAYIGDCWTAGLFANVSRHEIDGSGNLKSDVGTLGLYGSMNQGIWYVDGSLSIGWGNHDSERKIHIPGWVYKVYDGSYIRYDDINRTAKGNTNSLDFSGRIAGGALLFDWGDWRMNAEADLIGSYLSYEGYKEKGADSLNLHMGRYNSSYLESGVTLGVTRLLRGGERPLFVNAKVGARYGKMFDHGLSGKFRSYGSKFKVDPEMLSSFWATPELSLNWQITDQVFMYASYQGRFGEDRQGHTGRLGVEYAW